MNNINEIIKRIKADEATWNDFSCILKMQDNDLNQIFSLTQEIKKSNFENKLKIYVPGKRFPAISITGSDCKLRCEHCNEKYLKSMKPILNSNSLKNYLFSLWENGGVGALISGGCEEDGSVPIYNFLDAINEVKKNTDLIINTHTGLLNASTAQKMAQSNVDLISFDVNVDPLIIKDIYHLDKDITDYENAIKIMQQYELNIIPHICIGLYYGKLHKELDTIKFIKENFGNPPLIVAIVLIPPKKSEKKFITPEPLEIIKILTLLRIIFPSTEISLGCMRPKTKNKEVLEKLALKAGINRIVLPSKKTIKWLKDNHPDVKLSFFSSCCALPKKFEEIATCKENEITAYNKI